MELINEQAFQDIFKAEVKEDFQHGGNKTQKVLKKMKILQVYLQVRLLQMALESQFKTI